MNQNVEKMRYKILFLLLVPVLLIGCFQASKESQTEIESLLGKEITETVKQANYVTFFKLKPNRKALIPSEEIKVLNQKEIHKLLKFVLNDKHYLLDRKKKVLFTPQFGFKFEGKKTLWLVVSTPANQIKFIEGQKSVVLDYDPMKEGFETFCKSLQGEGNA
jgi:hypothetical protein